MSLFRESICWLLLTGATLFPVSLAAQSKTLAASAPTPALNALQEVGKGVFLQNCALCHFALRNPKDPKTRTEGKTIGPRLNGRLSGENPLSDAVARTFILKGVEGKMPGFQYSLDAKEIDDVIAYLKTL